MNDIIELRTAQCCKVCANKDMGFFRFTDAVLCTKTNTYQQNTQVCNLFKEEKKP